MRREEIRREVLGVQDLRQGWKDRVTSSAPRDMATALSARWIVAVRALVARTARARLA